MLSPSAFPTCGNPVCLCKVGTNPPPVHWDCRLQTTAQMQETVRDKRQWRNQISDLLLIVGFFNISSHFAFFVSV